MSEVYLRWMVRADLPAVLAIERRVFDTPWNESEFSRMLSHPHAIGMVSEDSVSGVMVGYMVYELAKRRLEIHNLAVSPWHRRRGVGAIMVGALKSKLSSERRTRLVADVRERNLDAQLFFKRLGFRAIRISHGRFELPDGALEDAYVMQYRHRAAVVATRDNCQGCK